MIQQHPGMVASKLAELCATRAVSWFKYEVNGFVNTANGNQARTRWGAQYAKPLIDQGLVRAEHNYYGWAKLHLTPLGQQVARSGKMTEV